MKIAVLKERRAGEPRVAATPDTVKKFVSAGHEVAVEADSGTLSGIRDGDFADAGAKICPDAKATLAGADLILKVRALMADEFEQCANKMFDVLTPEHEVDSWMN